MALSKPNTKEILLHLAHCRPVHVDHVDIIVLILSYLPVESLGKFMTVCKSWNSVIRKKYFIELQLSQSRENPFYAVFKARVHRSASGRIPSLCIAVTSWNGLVCLQSIFESPFVGSGKLSIWNAVTRQIFDIPRDENCFSSTDYRLGVAYGPECYDYKIYKIVRSPIKKGRQECRMYSSTTGRWKSLGLTPSYPVYSYHVFVNGTVYWLSSNEISGFPGAILSVDIFDKIRTFDSPVRGFDWPYLISLGGSLGLVVVYKEVSAASREVSAASREVSVTSRMIVWVLESPPPLPIWTKKLETYIPLFPVEQTISAAAWGNHVVITTPGRHLKFHIDKKAWTEVMSSKGVIDDTTFSCFFSKSLLPCNGVIES